MFCEGMDSDSEDRVTCGGYFAFDLYKLSWPESSTSEEYIECFADLKTNRVMDDMMIMNDMTPAMCREHCVSLTAKFYGLQVRYSFCARKSFEHMWATSATKGAINHASQGCD